MTTKQLYDLFSLTLAQQAMINKYASEPLTNRFMQQNSRHRTIHTARQTANDAAIIANLLTDGVNGLTTIGFHGPVCAAPTYGFGKIFQ